MAKAIYVLTTDSGTTVAAFSQERYAKMMKAKPDNYLNLQEVVMDEYRQALDREYEVFIVQMDWNGVVLENIRTRDVVCGSPVFYNEWDKFSQTYTEREIMRAEVYARNRRHAQRLADALRLKCIQDGTWGQEIRRQQDRVKEAKKK